MKSTYYLFTFTSHFKRIPQSASLTAPFNKGANRTWYSTIRHSEGEARRILFTRVILNEVKDPPNGCVAVVTVERLTWGFLAMLGMTSVLVRWCAERRGRRSLQRCGGLFSLPLEGKGDRVSGGMRCSRAAALLRYSAVARGAQNKYCRTIFPPLLKGGGPLAVEGFKLR